MLKIKNPTLRFKDKEGKDYPDWEIKKLGELGEFLKGSGLSKSLLNQNGQYECILYGEIFTLYNNIISKVVNKTNEYNNVLSKEGDILLPSSTTTNAYDLVKPVLLNIPNVLLGGDIIIIRNINLCYNSLFLMYAITSNREQISTLAQGITIIHLYGNTLSTFKIPIPTMEEQIKIGNFLKSIDEKIEIQGKKLEELKKYKKGLMQQLFPSNNNTNPTLRFKDKEGKDYPDWEIKKFENIFRLVKFTSVKVSEMSISGRYPVISQDKGFISGYLDDSTHIINNLPIILYGDHTTILKFIDFTFIVAGDGIKLLKENQDNNLLFLFYMLSVYNIPFKGYQRHFTILKSIIIPIPSMEEQIKIGNFLKSIDEKIEIQGKKLEELKKYKKGLMQQLFPAI